MRRALATLALLPALAACGQSHTQHVVVHHVGGGYSHHTTVIHHYHAPKCHQTFIRKRLVCR